MAITNYLVHFLTEDTYNSKKSELRNDAVAFVKDATIIHTHGTDYYCGSSPVALKSDLSGYATTSALTSGLAGKANTSHTHTISQVSGLQAELDSKLESADLSGYALKTDIPTVTLASLGVTATATELNRVDGVTSNIQTQLNGKQASITGGASTITSSNLTTSRALISNTSGKVAASEITSTELGYLEGVKSNIQTQLNGKAASLHDHTASQVSGLAAVATSGSYNDLEDLPNIPEEVIVDTALSSTSTNPVQNKVINSALAGKASTLHTHTASQVSDLAAVATSGSYNDLDDKPTIPAAYTLPTASASTLGGIKTGYFSTTGKKYAVRLDSNSNAYVTVDWTDTHYTANLYAGNSIASSNTTTTNGNTHLILVENSLVRDRINITGTGLTTVSSNSSGDITINGKTPTLNDLGITATASELNQLDGVDLDTAFATADHIHSSYESSISGLQSIVSTLTSKFTDYLPLIGGTINGNLTINGELTLSGESVQDGSIQVGTNTLTIYEGADAGIEYNGAQMLTENNWDNYITIPEVDTDAVNKAGATNQTSLKLFLVGARNQAAGEFTYSNVNVYTQSGQLYATRMNTTSGFYETSDARLKNFHNDVKALEIVSAIPTKYFTWKKDEIEENQDAPLHIGTSAQEIQKLYPDLVSEDSEGNLTVDYARLSIVALAAIKELKAEVDELKTKLNNK